MTTKDGTTGQIGPQAVIAMPAEIDIDMSETTFWDSAGVQAVVAAYQAGLRQSWLTPQRHFAGSHQAGPFV